MPNEPRPNLPHDPASILLYGDTDAGKTTQIGFWAKWLFKATGGKIVDGKAVGGLRTRLYACDKARWESLSALVELGIIEVKNCLEYRWPTIWVPHIAQGEWLDLSTKPKPSWVKTGNEHIGCYAFDGLTGISDMFMEDMRDAAKAGKTIGGEAAMRYSVKDDLTGESVETGLNNLGHFRVAQDNVRTFIGVANRLVDKGNYVIFTATQRRGEEDTRQVISGPEVAGKALTPELPRLVTYTFQLVTIPKDPINEHQLFIESHLDRSAGGAKAMANARIPMSSPSSMPKDLKRMYSPADMVLAYQSILGARKQAKDELIRELS